MTGINASTGKPLSGFAHFQQSISDILRTRIGSRCMRRDYGSNLANRVDNPINPQTLAHLYYDAAYALVRWEPRLALQKVTCSSVSPGQITLSISGTYIPGGVPITIDGVAIGGPSTITPYIVTDSGNIPTTDNGQQLVI